MCASTVHFVGCFINGLVLGTSNFIFSSANFTIQCRCFAMFRNNSRSFIIFVCYQKSCHLNEKLFNREIVLNSIFCNYRVYYTLCNMKHDKKFDCQQTEKKSNLLFAFHSLILSSLHSNFEQICVICSNFLLPQYRWFGLSSNVLTRNDVYYGLTTFKFEFDCCVKQAVII